ncbi:hypothetical protein I2I05_05555 [Hymenobacter sp. BT683]|uniref:Uncharacterized protein n=1 Tax=Hymenobacter jeongseonensis TaxID=2791027 RepID=A0ABS0IES2_9BACT|nr:hypothetical protein [Hymenobacter jeongseonensis]MBF9236856.1 hypothetical protein [Hymenobacter jeongseonensis]
MMRFSGRKITAEARLFQPVPYSARQLCLRATEQHYAVKVSQKSEIRGFFRPAAAIFSQKFFNKTLPRIFPVVHLHSQTARSRQGNCPMV